MDVEILRCWEDSNFAITQMEMNTDEVRRFILSSWKNNKGTWFGGRSRECSRDIRKEKGRLLTLTALAVACSKMADVSLLSELCDYFPSSDSVICSVLENDGRILYLVLALFRITKSHCLPDVLNPVRLALWLLRRTAFDAELVLDWLDSESVAASLWLCVLRSLDSDMGHWKELADEMDRFCVKRARVEVETREVWKEEPRTREGEREGVTIVVRQLAGEICDQKTFHFSSQPSSYYVVEERDCPELEYEEGETVWDRLTDFIHRLSLKLDKLQASGLAPFNLSPLIRAMERVESALEKEGIGEEQEEKEKEENMCAGDK